MKKRFFLSLLLLTQSSAFAQLACPTVKYDWTRPFLGSFRETIDSQGYFLLLEYVPEVQRYRTIKRNDEGDLIWTYDVRNAQAVAVDSANNVIIGGVFSGTVDFDPGPGVTELTHGPSGSFVAKLTGEREFLWVTQLAGPEYQYSWGPSVATVDLEDNIILAGSNGNIAVAKLSADGEHLWNYQMGSVGNHPDEADHVATDADNNVYISGYFTGFINLNPIFLGWPDWHDAVDCPGGTKSFVTKFSPDGDYLWSRSTECGLGFGPMAVQPDGSVIYGGSFNGTRDFDPTEGVDLRSSDGTLNPEYADYYITKLNSDSSYGWTYILSTPEFAQEIYFADLIVDPKNGDILISALMTGLVDFDPTDGILESDCQSALNCDLLLRLSSEGFPRWFIRTPNFPNAASVALDSTGNIFQTRTLYYETDLDSSCAEDWWSPPPIPDPPPFPGYRTRKTILTKYSCRNITGDIDNDGDVDLLDLAAFQNCFEGSDRDTCSPGCDAFDLHSDNSLDLFDYSRIQKEFAWSR